MFLIRLFGKYYNPNIPTLDCVSDLYVKFLMQELYTSDL